MAYCERADIEARLPEAVLLRFTDLDQDGVEDAGVVTRAIAAASGICDSYLAVRYATPIDAPPDALRSACVALTIWKLAVGRGIDLETADKALDIERKDALAWLRDVGAGKAALILATATPTEPAQPTSGIAVSAPPSLLKFGGFGG